MNYSKMSAEITVGFRSQGRSLTWTMIVIWWWCLLGNCSRLFLQATINIVFDRVGKTDPVTRGIEITVNYLGIQFDVRPTHTFHLSRVLTPCCKDNRCRVISSFPPSSAVNFVVIALQTLLPFISLCFQLLHFKIKWAPRSPFTSVLLQPFFPPHIR